MLQIKYVLKYIPDCMYAYKIILLLVFDAGHVLRTWSLQEEFWLAELVMRYKCIVTWIPKEIRKSTEGGYVYCKYQF